MELEKELLEKGYEASGPHGFSELPKALEILAENLAVTADALEEIRLIRGSKARDDMKDPQYKNVWMIYYK
jgi:hypothetical protein